MCTWVVVVYGHLTSELGARLRLFPLALADGAGDAAGADTADGFLLKFSLFDIELSDRISGGCPDELELVGRANEWRGNLLFPPDDPLGMGMPAETSPLTLLGMPVMPSLLRGR
ncbi:hypothetical protein CGLO_02010 [Colletotrichum gloeosporioides Cg-14]|uniref:Uncharacterized protein n=1 Tax=Colletotrichum gloeosporioides (strain Cg-14) TaxID=1237896 RepID=T0M226_COLGC|nr:hypothetical protein CGLO_02010 [Colletotrichum gloeosporioides Cg-14]